MVFRKNGRLLGADRDVSQKCGLRGFYPVFDYPDDFPHIDTFAVRIAGTEFIFVFYTAGAFGSAGFAFLVNRTVI